MTEAKTDTVAFVQEWMISGDHKADQWHRDFAAAIDARSTIPEQDAALNKIADLGSCANGKTPAYKLFQQAIDIATGAL